MKSNGFTVLEMLIAIVVTGVIIGLVTNTLMVTKTGVSRAADRADETVEASRFLGEVIDQIAIIQMDQPMNFSKTEMTFHAGSPDGVKAVFLGNDADNEAIISMDSAMTIRFQGNLELRFYHNENWMSEWPFDDPPEAVSCVLTPLEKKTPNSWQIVVNLPSGYSENDGEKNVDPGMDSTDNAMIEVL